MIPIIINAGGYGNRLRPITTIIPKPLIPIINETFLERQLDKFYRQGFKKFYIITYYLSTMIESYIRTLNHPYDIEFIKEKTPLGTVGGISLLPEDINQFILINCDTIIDSNYTDIINKHNNSRSSLTIVTTTEKTELNYGILDINDFGHITKLTEKPSYLHTINTGMYVFSKTAKDLIEPDTFTNINHLIDKLLFMDKTILSYNVQPSSVIDIGTLGSYKKYIKTLNLDTPLDYTQ